MTVIAWDGKLLAADKRATNTDGLVRTVTKITEVHWQDEDSGTDIKYITGIAGDPDVCMELLSWFQDGADPSEFPVTADKGDGTLVAISHEFGVQQWSKGPEPIYFEDDFLAWGAGRDFAIAAMAMGMSAVEAVDLASKHNAFCGNGIDVLPMPVDGTVH